MLVRIWNVLYSFIWVLLVYTWPLVKWVLSFFSFFYFVRIFYCWGDPTTMANVLTFGGIFLALTVLTKVVVTKPKNSFFSG